MGRLPSYRDFTPLLGTMRLPGIPYSPSFELSRQKNSQPVDSVRRSEKKRPNEGSRRMALSGRKTFARPEYVPLWNSELNVWRSGFVGFLSPLAKSVANPMRGRQGTDEKQYLLSAVTTRAAKCRRRRTARDLRRRFVDRGRQRAKHSKATGNGERFKQSPWRPPSPSGPQSGRNCQEVRCVQSSEILLELVFSDVTSFDHVCAKVLEVCPH